MTLTGQQIKNVLEQQFRGCGTQNGNRLMQPSASLSYEFTPAAGWSIGNTTVFNTGCNWVNANTMQINGIKVEPTSSYRVTVNNFMASGGDNYVEFKQGTKLLGGAVDIDALEAYFQASGTVAVPNFVAQPRMSNVPN
jgi:5'-nucleotidase